MNPTRAQAIIAAKNRLQILRQVLQDVSALETVLFFVLNTLQNEGRIDPNPWTQDRVDRILANNTPDYDEKRDALKATVNLLP